MKKNLLSIVLVICMLFSLFAIPAEAASNQTETVINAITSYVAQNTFKSSYRGKAWGCFAFCNYVWKNVFGYDYYSGNYIGVDTKGPSSNIYQFLSQNQAKAGDILWCHTADNKISHNMIVLNYDTSGIWLSDATSGGKLWHNNTKISYTSADYKQYLGGNCILKLYKIDNNLWNEVSQSSKISTPIPVGRTSKPSVSVNGQSVTVSWTYSGSATKFDVYLLKAPWRWEDIKYRATLTGNSFSFKDVAPGEYQAFVIARPNADTEQSEWVPFVIPSASSPSTGTASVPENSVEPSSSTTSVATGSYFTIKNLGSGKMLNVVSNSSNSGANVTVYQADGTTGQNFMFISNGRGGYVLEPQCAPSCALNVYGQSSTPGANVNIWTKSGNRTQDWNIEYNSAMSGYVVRSADNPSYVLAASGSGNASNVQLQQYDSGSAFQIWISNAFGTVSSPNENPTSQDTPAPVSATISPYTDTYYTVRNVGSEKMLNVVSNSSRSGTNVTIYQADGTTGQNFLFISDGAGGYVLQPQCAPTCALNVYGQSSLAGENVNIWTKSGNSTQSWIIETNSRWNAFTIRSKDNPNYVLASTGTGNTSNIQIQEYNSENPLQAWTSGAFHS